MQKPNPRGCFGNPGICLKCAQGQKSLKGLPRAAHSTDRAQTSSNVSPTVELCPPHPTFGTKVRARRDVPEGKTKITIIHINFGGALLLDFVLQEYSLVSAFDDATLTTCYVVKAIPRPCPKKRLCLHATIRVAKLASRLAD